MPVSWGDLINYLSSSAVHFFRHCVLFCFQFLKTFFLLFLALKKIIEVLQSFLMAACVRACSVASVISDSLQPCELAYQAPLSMGFSRQGYWRGLPFPSPGAPPDSGIEPKSPVPPALQVDFLPLSHWGIPMAA